MCQMRQGSGLYGQMVRLARSTTTFLPRHRQRTFPILMLKPYAYVGLAPLIRMETGKVREERDLRPFVEKRAEAF